MWGLADMLDEVRERSCHLQSVLEKRESRVSSSEWEVRAPAKSGKRADGIAKWCQERLHDIEQTTDLGRSFPDAVSDLLGAVYYGRSVLEAIWSNEGRYWYPSQLEFVHSRRCAYTSDWRLHLWDALGVETALYLGPEYADRDIEKSPFGRFPGVAIDNFPAGKFVIHRPRIRGVYPTREGLGPVVLWYAIFSRFVYRDWLAFAEWAGRGLRLGQYSSGNKPDSPGRASDADVQELRDAIDNLSSSVSTVFPDTTNIDVRDAPTNNDVHEKLSSACNLEISKCVLLETLTTEIGTLGSKAATEVHAAVGDMLAKKDARALAATIRRDLLRPMVARSFGPTAIVPEIVFDVVPAEDANSAAKRASDLIKSGIPLDATDVREKSGFLEPQSGRETVGGLVPEIGTAQPGKADANTPSGE